MQFSLLDLAMNDTRNGENFTHLTCLMQTWVDFGKNIIEVVIEQCRDCVCMLVADTLNTCCEIVVHLHYVVHQNIL